jgi:hypothetical protein
MISSLGFLPAVLCFGVSVVVIYIIFAFAVPAVWALYNLSYYYREKKGKLVPENERHSFWYLFGTCQWYFGRTLRIRYYIVLAIFTSLYWALWLYLHFIVSVHTR